MQFEVVLFFIESCSDLNWVMDDKAAVFEFKRENSSTIGCPPRIIYSLLYIVWGAQVRKPSYLSNNRSLMDKIEKPLSILVALALDFVVFVFPDIH